MSIGGSRVDGGISVQLYETVFNLINLFIYLISETVAEHHFCNCAATDVDKVCTIVRFVPIIIMNNVCLMQQ